MVVDDERIVLTRLKQVLEKMGLAVHTFSNAFDALEDMKKRRPHVVIADVKMPGMDGIELLQRIKAVNEVTEVIVISGYANLDTAIEVTRKGAFYYLSKPFNLDQFRIIVEKALEKVRLSMENARLRDQIKARYQFKDIVFKSLAMREIFATVEKIANLDYGKLYISYLFA